MGDLWYDFFEVTCYICILSQWKLLILHEGSGVDVEELTDVLFHNT